jgi:hypothetical protein
MNGYDPPIGRCGMQTFQEFLRSEARQGGVNLLFESAMYSLVDELERIARILADARVPFEVIGGMAVNAHLLASQQRSRTFVTKDIDLLVQRNDLPAIVQAAQAAGYAARKIMGGFMLIWPGQQPAEAVHLVFVGEKSKSTNPLPHPPINFQSMQVFGIDVPVAELTDLARMKLNSFRAKDLVHLEILDSCGMITAQIEQQLPPTLYERLIEARKQFAGEQPDVE